MKSQAVLKTRWESKILYESCCNIPGCYSMCLISVQMGVVSVRKWEWYPLENGPTASPPMQEGSKETKKILSLELYSKKIVLRQGMR